jgi:hypothetical protein
VGFQVLPRTEIADDAITFMHTKHRAVRRRDDGVLDPMVPHLQRGNGGD